MRPMTREDEGRVLLFGMPHCAMRCKVWVRLPEESPRTGVPGIDSYPALCRNVHSPDDGEARLRGIILEYV